MKSLYKSIVKYPISLVFNVLSLLIAFTGIITLVLYISYENNYDTFNKNYDNIYKINIGKDDGTVPAKIAPIIEKNITNIEDITPLWFISNAITTNKLKSKKIAFYQRGMYANNQVFNIFTFPLILGEKEKALTNAYTIVLTEKLAKKLFGKENPIGKKVLLNKDSFTVTGVMKNIPDNASFHVSYICSFITQSQTPDSFTNSWSEWSFQVFCKVSKQANIAELTRKINSIDEFENYFAGKDKKRDKDTLFHLKPLSALHFSSNNNFNIVNKKVLNVLSVLALVLFIMGMVNFINLTTAQSFQKSKSLSMKRVFGASKKSVFTQVIVEAVIISLFVMSFSFIAHRFLYPFLQNNLGISGMGFGNRPQYYFYFVAMAIIFGIIAGVYPAFYLNATPLSQSIHGAINLKDKGKSVRTVLLDLQFVFAVVLIISSIGIAKQISFWHNFDIGIQKKNIIYLRTTNQIRKHYKAFADELIKNRNITEYTYSNFVPGSVGMGWGRMIDGQQVNFTSWPVDEHFVDFFNIKIVKGRSFSKNMEVDKGTFILNEKAVEKFGWQKPLEKRIYGFSKDGSIVGIAKNFNFASLKEGITPMVFWLYDGRRYNLLLKIKPKNLTQTISYIKTIWGKFEPVQDFNFKFLDDTLNRLYQKEERISNFIRIVTLWSMLLSIIGLLGLVIFTTRLRTKEIGIRRVNGASIFEIVKMLNLGFLKQVIFAFIIASPIAYYALKKWLESFAYKTTLSWWIFALAGIIILLFALLATSWFTWHAAKQNPVKSLKTE
ncbi:MAG: ABC transporter permease [Flavobacteriaceae bacterium]